MFPFVNLVFCFAGLPQREWCCQELLFHESCLIEIFCNKAKRLCQDAKMRKLCAVVTGTFQHLEFLFLECKLSRSFPSKILLFHFLLQAIELNLFRSVPWLAMQNRKTFALGQEILFPPWNFIWQIYFHQMNLLKVLFAGNWDLLQRGQTSVPRCKKGRLCVWVLSAHSGKGSSTCRRYW